MVSTFTPNIQLNEPARGDDVGTWDTPVNANTTLLDLVCGGIVTIPLNNSNIVLSAAQFQCKTITFNSTLTGNVIITFPTSFTKSYEIQHLCTGSSAFVIQLLTASAGQAVAAVPGQVIEVLNDGTNIIYKNFGVIGSYVDYAGTTPPIWNNACSVPPYLHCNGTTFSSSTYPVLAAQIGTTLPDFRGRSPYYLNEGTGRLTSGGAGIDGTTLFAAGGTNGVTLGTSNLPAYTPSGTISVPVPGGMYAETGANVVQAGTNLPLSAGGAFTFNGNAQGGVSANIANAAPGAVAGIRMIRAG